MIKINKVDVNDLDVLSRIDVDNFEDDILFILIKENDKEAEDKAKNIVRNLLIENKRNIILNSNKKNFEEISKYV